MPSNTSSSTPSLFTMNNETLTNSTDFANQLNYHFVINIGKSAVTNSSRSNANDYLTYFRSGSVCSLYFNPKIPSEIMNMITLISKLKINKANGRDDVMPFFLKISALIIFHSSSAIQNQCIAFGYFPNKLKIAKVIHVYDAGPTNQAIEIIVPFLFYLPNQKFLTA